MTIQNLWDVTKEVISGKSSNINLPQETKILNKQPIIKPKAARDRRTTTTTKNPKLVKGKKS